MREIDGEKMKASFSDVNGKTYVKISFEIGMPKRELISDIKQIVDTLALYAGVYDSV